MIEARELFVGAKILDNHNDVCTVKGFDDGVIRTVENRVLTLKYAYPIPLTEEWLLKAGFIHLKTGWQRHLLKDNSINVIPMKERCLVGISGAFGLINSKNINSVHQLQNLFFSLTGEELQFTHNVQAA